MLLTSDLPVECRWRQTAKALQVCGFSQISAGIKVSAFSDDLQYTRGLWHNTNISFFYIFLCEFKMSMLNYKLPSHKTFVWFNSEIINYFKDTKIFTILQADTIMLSNLMDSSAALLFISYKSKRDHLKVYRLILMNTWSGSAYHTMSSFHRQQKAACSCNTSTTAYKSPVCSVNLKECWSLLHSFIRFHEWTLFRMNSHRARHPWWKK